jgi:hypothetical protein
MEYSPANGIFSVEEFPDKICRLQPGTSQTSDREPQLDNSPLMLQTASAIV